MDLAARFRSSSTGLLWQELIFVTLNFVESHIITKMLWFFHKNYCYAIFIMKLALHESFDPIGARSGKAHL